MSVAAVPWAAHRAGAVPLYGIDTGKPTQSLISFDSTTPNTLRAAYAIQGLQTNEQLIGIDVRPQDGKLYGVGNSGRLYTIDPTGGQAVAVPFTGGAETFPVLLNGTRFGIDFNPGANFLQIVSDLGQNLRVHFTDGAPAVLVTDSPLHYSATDPFGGGRLPNIAAIAYDNNFAQTSLTTLRDIDASLNALAVQDPPLSGTLRTVGLLGVDTTSNVGFDIGARNLALASLQELGAPASQLYAINLTTGGATLIGLIGRGEDGPLIADLAIADINFVPAPSGLPLLCLGAATTLARRRRRRRRQAAHGGYAGLSFTQPGTGPAQAAGASRASSDTPRAHSHVR